MRILALDHGTKRIGVAVSDETKTIAQPLEYIPAEPFADFLERLKQLLVEKEVDLDSHRSAAQHGRQLRSGGAKGRGVRRRVAKRHHRPDQDLGRTADVAQANRILIQGNVRRDKRKEKVDKMAAAILLQSYLDGI